MIMENLKHLIYNYLVSAGLTESAAKYGNMIALGIITLLLVFLIDFIFRKILLGLFVQYARKSKTNFDNLLVINKTPRNIAHIIPLLVALELVPIIFADFPKIEKFIETGLKIFSIVLALWIVRSVLHTLRDYFKTLPRLKDKPIDSYIQVFMILAWVSGFLFAFVILTKIPLLTFLAGMGAASAVFLLIFKDTILGFVASIQVSINNIVKIGDWVTFDKYGADGDVIEINLSTVKVQNFDKTITTIPTYALISDSFKNWRGMVNSDGRRIKRALNIKLDSVKYLTKNEVDSLKKIELISAYLEKRQSDIEAFNESHNINKEIPLNGRNLTNLGVFRKYIETYIEKHPAINKNMMIMARQLAPTSEGIPLEIYAFSSDKRWQNYEYIMSDIFDHLIAAVPYFNLEIFEFPSKSDFNPKVIRKS
jgi:miniconductance mechanosensitive channel